MLEDLTPLDDAVAPKPPASGNRRPHVEGGVGEPLVRNRARPCQPSRALAVARVDEPQRARQQRDGLLVGVPLEQPLGRPFGERRRAIGVGAAGCAPAQVEGDLDERRARLEAVLLLERGCSAPVQSLSPRAAQAAVEGLADERVREAVGRPDARCVPPRPAERRPPPPARRSACPPARSTIARRTSNENSRPEHRRRRRAPARHAPTGARAACASTSCDALGHADLVGVSAPRSSARRARTATPVSIRWRRTSSTKNGLPSVCSWTRADERRGAPCARVRRDQRADVALVAGPRARCARRAGRGAGRPAARRAGGRRRPRRRGRCRRSAAAPRADARDDVAQQVQRRAVGPVEVVEHEQHRRCAATRSRPASDDIASNSW